MGNDAAFASGTECFSQGAWRWLEMGPGVQEMREIGVESRRNHQGVKYTEEEPPTEKGTHLTSARED